MWNENKNGKDIFRFFTMSLGMIVVGIILWVLLNPAYGAGIILGGVILAATGLYVATKPKEYFMQNEKSIRITEKAGYHAFGIMLVTTSIMVAIDLSASFPIKYRAGVVPVQLAGIYSFFILRWYYNKKGE